MFFWLVYWQCAHLFFQLWGGYIGLHGLHRAHKFYQLTAQRRGKTLWWQPHYTYRVLQLALLAVIAFFLYEAITHLAEGLATHTLRPPLLKATGFRLVLYALLSLVGSVVLGYDFFYAVYKCQLNIKTWESWRTALGFITLLGLLTEVTYLV